MFRFEVVPIGVLALCMSAFALIGLVGAGLAAFSFLVGLIDEAANRRMRSAWADRFGESGRK